MDFTKRKRTTSSIMAGDSTRISKTHNRNDHGYRDLLARRRLRFAQQKSILASLPDMSRT